MEKIFEMDTVIYVNIKELVPRLIRRKASDGVVFLSRNYAR